MCRCWSPANVRRGWVAGLIVVALFLFSNIAGDRRDLAHAGSEWPFIEYTDHGWPWRFLIREERFDQIPHSPMSIWQLTKHVQSFSPMALAGNILVASFAGLAAAWCISRAGRSAAFKWQFSLRTLLGSAVICGVGLSTAIYLVGHYREHRQFILALRELDASVQVVPAGPDWLRDWLSNDYRIFDEYDSVDLPTATLTPILARGDENNAFVRMCRCSEKMGAIKTLRIAECKQFRNEHLALLHHARNLDCLFVDDTAVTSDGFVYLSSFPRLRQLHFRNTQVTDSGIPYLIEHPQLQSVACGGSKVSLEGMSRLRARYFMRRSELD